MEIETIIQEIKQLPLNKKFQIIEEALNSIKKEQLKDQMNAGAEGVNTINFNEYLISEKS